MEFKDYYKTLGVNKEADEKEVKDSFKKLAKKYHPDTEGGSEDKFKELSEAYEVLKDKDKRSRYDYLYSNYKNANNFDSQTQTFKQKKMYSDLNSFTEFYKQKEQDLREKQARERMQEKQRNNPGAAKATDPNFSDFFEMFFGKQKEKMATETAQTTSTPKPLRGEDFEMDIELNLEDAYHGCLRKIEITAVNSVRRLEVSIPAGVRNGTKIKVANEGRPGKNNGPNGDLYLNVKLKEHDYFWIDEDDVHSEITIEPQDAVLGCTKKIPTLEDIVELVIPPKTYNGRILRLRSKGLKNSKGEVLGDHYVHVLIDIPRNLTEEEIKSYQYLRELSARR